MTHLAQALKKYYRKEGNKLVFQNKYSLNQLALEMWERMEYAGMDPSLLSRVISGQRFFTVKQFYKFADILNLGRKQKNELLEALEQDRLSRFGLQLFSTSNQSISDVISLLRSSRKSLHFARERGNVSFVIDFSDNIIEWLSNYLENQVYNKNQRILLSVLGDVLYEKGYVYCSTLLPELNKRLSKPIAYQLFDLAKKTKSVDLMVKAYTILGFTYYALGKYSFDRTVKKFYIQSLHETRKALKISEGQERLEEFTLIYWRYMAMNSLYINDRDLFSTAEKKISEIVNRRYKDFSFTFSVCALATLARGQSHFKKSQAIETLGESKLFDKSISWRNPVREAETIRNEIEVLQNLKRGNKTYQVRLLRRGLSLCEDFQIFRYKPLFKKFSSRL